MDNTLERVRCAHGQHSIILFINVQSPVLISRTLQIVQYRSELLLMDSFYFYFVYAFLHGLIKVHAWLSKPDFRVILAWILH